MERWAKTVALHVSEAEALLLKKEQGPKTSFHAMQTYSNKDEISSPSSVCLNCINLPPEEPFILMNFRYTKGYSQKTSYWKAMSFCYLSNILPFKYISTG